MMQQKVLSTKLEHNTMKYFVFRLGCSDEMEYVCISSERNYEEFSLHVVTPTEVGRIANSDATMFRTSGSFGGEGWEILPFLFVPVQTLRP